MGVPSPPSVHRFLAEPRGVVADECVGGFQDVAGGAVVLLQLDDPGAGEILLEAQDVLDLGAAPGVDGLVVVTHHEGDAVRAGQHAHRGILDGVGVLELVHQDVAETAPVVCQQVRVLEPQLVGTQQEFREIDEAAAFAGFLVGPVHLEQRVLEGVIALLDVASAQAVVLARVDEPLGLPRRVAGLIQLQALEQAPDQAVLVLGIQDLEALRQARFTPVLAQQAVGDAVEVPIHMLLAEPPMSRSTRPRISAAALLVKVTARMP